MSSLHRLSFNEFLHIIWKSANSEKQQFKKKMLQLLRHLQFFPNIFMCFALNTTVDCLSVVKLKRNNQMFMVTFRINPIIQSLIEFDGSEEFKLKMCISLESKI